MNDRFMPPGPGVSEGQLKRDRDRIESEIAGTDGGIDPFAAAVRATRMPMIITDPNQPDNPIAFVNASFCRLTGYDREEIVGRNCRFLQGPETDPATVQKLREAIADRRPIEIDIRNHKKDGTPFWNRLLMAPVFDAAGELAYFFASQLDVTMEKERLAALEGENASLIAAQDAQQRRLEFSEESLQLATDAAEIGTWDFDLTTNVLAWCDRTKGMFGFPRTVVCTMDDFYAGLHPDDREATSRAFAASIDPEQRLLYDVEYRTIGKEDGKVRWIAAKGKGLFDESGRCVRALGTAIDITARKEITERLKRNQVELRRLNTTLEAEVAKRTAEMRLYGDIVQSSVAPICAFDKDYRLIAFNQAHSDEFYRIFAHRVQIGEVFPDLFPPDQAPIMRAFMARALAGETYTVTEEFGDPDLAKPAWEVTYSPLRDAQGEVIGAFHYAKDISGRLRSDAELAVTQEALRQAQKMEAVGQLTGGLAHDFNNLLGVISGSLELINAKVARGRYEDLEKYITAAQTAVKRSASLTHRLLAFSRRQTLDPKQTNLNDLVSGMDELIRRTMGPSIAVEVEAAAGLWTTLVDPHQLENALLNLCLNARDAMPDGGRLRIMTGHHTFDAAAAKEQDIAPGAYVQLCVEDTGTGMPAEVIARAFEPFFTTKPTGQGTGLGLSMIYGFARQSGGQVHIDSKPGQGTKICIYLPKDDSVHVAAGEAPAREPVPRADRGETVLVVDDEAAIRMLIMEVLSELGYKAIEALDGPTAMKILESNIEIDLLVTDVGLPNGMNGRQVADAARISRPDLKVLFITGYAESVAVGGTDLGKGMSTIIKPFGMDDIARRIKEMIAG